MKQQTKSKIMINYLKTSDDKLYTSFRAYNQTKNEALSVSNGWIEINEFDTTEDLIDNLARHFKDDWKICTREEFNEFYKEQSIKLNEIVKEL